MVGIHSVTSPAYSPSEMLMRLPFKYAYTSLPKSPATKRRWSSHLCNCIKARQPHWWSENIMSPFADSKLSDVWSNKVKELLAWNQESFHLMEKRQLSRKRLKGKMGSIDVKLFGRNQSPRWMRGKSVMMWGWKTQSEAETVKKEQRWINPSAEFGLMQNHRQSNDNTSSHTHRSLRFYK